MNVMQIFDLSGKVAVITGAGNGLGYQFAEAMAEAGANVVCGDIDMKANEVTADHVRKLERKALARKCDVTNEADVAGLFKAADKEFGRVDIVFANAGIADPVPQPLHDYPTDNWNRVVAVNLQGVFYTDREALKIMSRQKSGKLINVASMWGLAGASSVFPIPAYNATKGAVVNLTRELALQYAPLNIQVNAICPGFFRTRLAGGAYDDPDFVAAITAFTPMGRVAEASEMKGTALYLASEASSYTTGLMLVTDGGCMAK
ncbi:MAG: Oxidoreductase, short-chain dehydrogenase/reductase family [Burkholderiaceae bacterium]|jgi:NAD(P)-dependent dehydrogenase (short-subunit alcohol dehydrogenase family)|nr:MAG: Oxidoreductase, short-chain dehydrogenase/reductase family [Burkholderiaceae bacterium]